MSDTIFAHGARVVPNRFSRRRQFEGVQSPTERFLLPVCLSMEEYEVLMGVIMTYEPDVWFRVLEATHFVDRPDLTRCGGDIDCGESTEGCCETITPQDERVEIRPADPRTSDEVPEGYLQNPFFVVTGGIAEGLGAKEGDILTTFDRLPADPISLLQLGLTDRLPTIAIKVEGEGTLTLKLPQVPQGGIAVIEVDDDYSSLYFVDMSSADLLELDSYIEALNLLIDTFTGERLEGSYINTESVDIRIEGEGQHEIEIIFWPKLDVDTFVGWGGGFSEALWCPDAAVRPTPEQCPPPRVYQDADGCIYWYDPLIRQERRICPEEFTNDDNPSGGDCCCCCCCCCESEEENMCCCGNQSGGGSETRRQVYYDETIDQLYYYGAQGVKLGVPPEAFSEQPLPPEVSDPESPDYEEPSGDNACFKAHGVWAAIEEFMEAYFDILADLPTVSTNPISFVARWRQNYPHLKMDSFELAAVPLESDADQENLEAEWDNKKSQIKNRFICAAQYRFDGSTRINDAEFRWVEDYQFDDDDEQLGDILEALVNAMKSEYAKLRSYEFVVAQQGECLCEGGSIPNDDASPGCSTWSGNVPTIMYPGTNIINDGASPQDIMNAGAGRGQNHAGLLKTDSIYRSNVDIQEARGGVMLSLNGDVESVDIEGFTLLYRLSIAGGSAALNFAVVIAFGTDLNEPMVPIGYDEFGGNVQPRTAFMSQPTVWAGFQNCKYIYIGLEANGVGQSVIPTLEILGLTLDYSSPQSPPVGFRQEVCGG